jgi:DNA-binding NarL/FixJ family response regulator
MPAEESPPTVLVVDDHPVVREGLAGMLRNAGYVVLEAGDGGQAVELASAERPDLVIMDVLMPAMSGIEATERITARNPAARVIMLSAVDSSETVHAAVKAGASGYLAKSAISSTSLVDAVRRTARGERVFVPPALVDALVSDPAQPSPATLPELSLREREIVALAAQGLGNPAIAGALGLSPRTVENHLARIYRKLGISTRTQLAVMAADQRIDRYPQAGKTCTVVVAEIAAFAAPARSNADQLTLRDALYELLREAFTQAGVPWSATQVQDRGDGVVIVLPPVVPATTLIGPCMTKIAAALRKHNSAAGEPLRIQLLVAVDTGPVTSDPRGVSGEVINRTFRLVQAAAFRDGLRSARTDLGVIMSGPVYDAVTRQGSTGVIPARLQSVAIDVKDWQATARMWFSEHAPSPGSGPLTRPIGGYGQGDALRLIRDFLSHQDRTETAERDDPGIPVLVFEGPRGIGKTTLLFGAVEQFGQELPCAVVDCENFSDDVRKLLLVSALGLSHGDRHRALRFPRLVTGLIATAEDLSATSYAEARIQLGRRLDLYQRSAAAFQELIAGEMTSLLAGTPPGGLGFAAAELVSTGRARQLLLGGHLPTLRKRRPLLHEGQEWYTHQDRQLQRDYLDVLTVMNQMASRPDDGDRNHEVAELLCAAFLADLRSSTGRKNGTGGCVLLLDNADAGVGPRFLHMIASVRRLNRTGEPDPLALVATSRGILSARFHGQAQVPLADASYVGYQLRRDNDPSHWLYAVAMPGLTQDETEQMTAALDLSPGERQAAAHMIHAFTAGHPRATLSLLSALARSQDHRPDLLTLLEQPDEQDTVEGRVLEDFLRGITPASAEDLITCSAARHREAALRLTIRGLLNWSDGPDSEALSAQFWWQDTAAGHAAMHPLLRRLLLRRLSSREDGAPASWRNVYEELYHLNLVSDNETEAMYYLLALGDVQKVTIQLERSLMHLDASSWLRLLHSVTAAPNQLNLRQPIYQQVRTLTQWAEPDREPTASIARLVAASWICSDPLSASQHHELRRWMAEQLQTIARHHPGPETTAFHMAANRNRDLANESRYT